MGNRLNKGGFENVVDHYTNCEINFLNIDNIHGVRDALSKVYEVVKFHDNDKNQNAKFMTQIDNSEWL